MIPNIHMKHPKFHHFWISRDSDVINVISRIVRNQLRLSGMFLVVSETATHASRLQSTVQIAPRGDSGYISGHLDVGVSPRHDRCPTNGAFAINCLRWAFPTSHPGTRNASSVYPAPPPCTCKLPQSWLRKHTTSAPHRSTEVPVPVLAHHRSHTG